jgi:hypothetical protein
MKKTLIFIVFFSSLAHAQSADGSMDCTVTGNVVVASEEGKFKTYSGIKGGVKANEKLILTYKVSNNSIYIELNRVQAENNTVMNAYLSSTAINTIAEKYKNAGFILTDTNFNHSISFLPDFIRVKDRAEFFISRYYKNDWHGIYSSVSSWDLTAQTLTLNCRQTDDKMDAAFKIFTDYKGQK